MTRSAMSLTLAMTAGLLLAACTHDATEPTAAALGSRVNAGSDVAFDRHHHITPRANLDVSLRGTGHGHIKFRQPRDDSYIVFLDTRVRGLAPNRNYQLQRAVDAVVDDDCTSEVWLTLGRLSEPLVIHTNGRGKGEALFTRDLSGAAGGKFDIHFRVIDAITGAVVLHSGCYQFKVRQ